MQRSDSVIKINGIGEKTASLFGKLGIVTVEDLLEYYPRNYDSYELPCPIESLAEGKTAAIEASLCTVIEIKHLRSLQVISCNVKDPSGRVLLNWFNQSYLKNTLRKGTRYIFRAKVVRKGGMLVMVQPKIYQREEYQRLLPVLQPVYGLTEGLTNQAVSKAVRKALDSIGTFEEFIPMRIKKEYQLQGRAAAMKEIHFPKDKDTMMEARRRLIFDEFFLFAIALQHRKEHKEAQKNCFILHELEQCQKFIDALPYQLTKAQQQVWQEIRDDMTGEYAMARLIQGDVGSGKTIIALLALLLTALNGYQGCIMVPTEVLANQHFEGMKELLTPFQVRIELLTGSMSAAQKKKVYERIEAHEVDVVVGTHALIQEKVVFDQLALVVTDEQHRFGVKQREQLAKKGAFPHMLVMSATPIPRTMAILLYGDLDLSEINELPKGRLPIKNCVVNTEYRPKAYQFIENQVKSGRQAYVICPMIEESESVEAENVTEYTDKLLEEIGGKKINISCLHGKMKQKEKNDIMERFAFGDIQVLVSTTVVEVGVNVPNATVMMIENAERFGLAQLHQLRGRVGRGKHQSYCILVSGSSSKETMERLEVLNHSNDGFHIAHEDLRLRGPGDIFGIRQSGLLEFKIGDIFHDTDLLKQANEAVKTLNQAEYQKVIEAYPRLEERILDAISY